MNDRLKGEFDPPLVERRDDAVRNLQGAQPRVLAGEGGRIGDEALRRPLPRHVQRFLGVLEKHMGIASLARGDHAADADIGGDRAGAGLESREADESR